jgi:hypothetical protein
MAFRWDRESGVNVYESPPPFISGDVRCILAPEKNILEESA